MRIHTGRFRTNLVKWGTADIHAPLLKELPGVAKQKRQQQGSDVGPVNVGIGQQHHLLCTTQVTVNIDCSSMSSHFQHMVECLVVAPCHSEGWQSSLRP